jgi:hypothetical protein
MGHSMWHPPIPIVFPFRVLLAGESACPTPGVESGFPVRGSTLFGLIPTVDGDGVMRPRGAKVTAPLRRAVVDKRSRVHKQFPAPVKQGERQGIRVGMRAGEHAETAAVEDQVTVERPPAGALHQVSGADPFQLGIQLRPGSVR